MSSSLLVFFRFPDVYIWLQQSVFQGVWHVSSQDYNLEDLELKNSDPTLTREDRILFSQEEKSYLACPLPHWFQSPLKNRAVITVHAGVTQKGDRLASCSYLMLQSILACTLGKHLSLDRSGKSIYYTYQHSDVSMKCRSEAERWLSRAGDSALHWTWTM